MTVLAWLGLWLGLSVLVYAIAVVRGDADDPALVRLLTDHARKLAHIERPERERVARKIAAGTTLGVAGLTGAILTGVIALLWMVTR